LGTTTLLKYGRAINSNATKCRLKYVKCHLDRLFDEIVRENALQVMDSAIPRAFTDGGPLIEEKVFTGIPKLLGQPIYMEKNSHSPA
jgi:hypothetical protein